MNGKMTENKSLIPNVPFHPGPVYRLPSKPIRPVVSNQQSSQSSPGIEDINPNINLNFKENSPLRRVYCPKLSMEWTNHFFKSLKN